MNDTKNDKIKEIVSAEGSSIESVAPILRKNAQLISKLVSSARWQMVERDATKYSSKFKSLKELVQSNSKVATIKE